jgi:Flp pilus assembly pilin Flp
MSRSALPPDSSARRERVVRPIEGSSSQTEERGRKNVPSENLTRRAEMSRTKTLIGRAVRRLGASDRGASLVEYALLVALIAVVAIAAMTTLGGNAGDKLDEAGTGIDGAGEEAVPEEDLGSGLGCDSVYLDGYATGPGYPYQCYSPSKPGGYDIPT